MRAGIAMAGLLSVLACAGCSGEKSTAELVADLQGAKDHDRVVAVRTLPKRHGDAAQVVPALIAALQDRDTDIRLSAAVGLGGFGEQARDAIPALKATLRDRDARVRRAAQTALTRIEGSAR